MNTYLKQRLTRLARFSFVSLFALLMYVAPTGAQVPKELPTSKSATVNAGSLLTQFMNGIKPSSFTDEWKTGKSNWLSSVGKIASAPGMIENITSLTKFIKPSMFKNGFNVQSLLQTATTAKSMADATGLLKNLEGGLKPEAMTSNWAGKKAGWLNALNLLK